MSAAIRVDGLVKHYRRQAAGFKLRTLKSALLRRALTEGLDDSETIPALADVSFEVRRGEAFGVIGGNGSGKSTLLKLVAGLLRPTRGRITVDGRVAALIELGAGFHPEISGRENIFINGAVLGLERRQVKERYDQIVEFSGLGDFLEEPVKTYSSGMYVRLGFAVAVHTEPDVLLVDEVLAVGDEEFGHRCLSKIEQLLAEGRTLLFVSHTLDLVESLCDRVLWLDRGLPRAIGSPRRTIDAYRSAVAEAEGRTLQRELEALSSAEEAAEAPPDRWGSQQATIDNARMIVGDEERYDCQSGAPVTFEVEVTARERLEDFVFGIAIQTLRGTEVWGTNTDLEGYRPQRLEGRARLSVVVPRLELAAGEYQVDFAIHARDGAPYDYRRRLLRLRVQSKSGGVGVYFPEHEWRATGGIVWTPPTGTER